MPPDAEPTRFSRTAEDLIASLRRVPLESVDRVSGAAAFLMFLGLTLSGVCFALLADALGGYRPGFLLLGGVAALAGGVSLLRAAVVETSVCRL